MRRIYHHNLTTDKLVRYSRLLIFLIKANCLKTDNSDKGAAIDLNDMVCK